MPSKNDKSSWIDGTLYPDKEPPTQLTTVEDRIDYLSRLCAAWDFGLLPEQESVAEICRIEWRSAVDQCRLLTSPTYHLLREWHKLPPLPYLGQQLAYIRDDPYLEYV
ncbi:MAG: hypothetical protein GY796_23480 [Chloroflexi bacterium]|nr:hypothetical protein [Chloroflexota bacterium]